MEDQLLKSLYGSEITTKRCVGFCKYHQCYMTATQVHRKECLRKQCAALEKYPHEYWVQRDLRKQEKKAKKESMIWK